MQTYVAQCIEDITIVKRRTGNARSKKWLVTCFMMLACWKPVENVWSKKWGHIEPLIPKWGNRSPPAEYLLG